MITGLNKAAQYRAIRGKNKKYDGMFYFAVKTTGIYCRPSCLLPCPLRQDCSFFKTGQQAKLEGYQACKSCHPGRLKNNVSKEVLDSIDAGQINDKGVHGLADSLHMSERHLRRLVKDRTGTSPTLLNKAKRLKKAKLLITQTKLPIIDVAFSAEFSSLRQFNDVFKDAFNVSPHEMRKTAVRFPKQAPPEGSM